MKPVLVLAGAVGVLAVLRVVSRRMATHQTVLPALTNRINTRVTRINTRVTRINQS